MSDANKAFRLITRSDFDGLACAVLLKEMNLLGDILFVHPKDVQGGKIDVGPKDILTNLPFDPRCHLCFDHHDSEDIRNKDSHATNHILDANADSAARVVYNYFGGRDRFVNVSEEMMHAVDVADAARYSRNDILAPTGWALLNFLMDPRTGLGRFRKFRISNYNLMMALIDYCRSHHNVDDILNLPDVRERVEVYNAHRERFCDQIARCARLMDNVVVLDLREEETIFAGNRFMVYALFPEANVSIHVLHGRNKECTILAMGKSILNRTNTANIGEIALEFGGGGHTAAGTCQVANHLSEEIVDVVARTLNVQLDESQLETAKSLRSTDQAPVGV